MKTHEKVVYKKRRIIFFIVSFFSIAVLAWSAHFFVPQDIEVGKWFLGAHTLFEMITIIIALTVAGYIFATYDQVGSKQFVIVASALISSAILDLLHTASFPGFLFSFLSPSVNLTLYFWIFARLILAAGIFFAAFFPYKKKKIDKRFFWVSISSAIFISGCVFWVVESLYPQLPLLSYLFGLTNLKILMEYIAIIFFLAAGIAITIQSYRSKENIPYYFLCFILLAMVAEVEFTLYGTLLSTHVFWGHLFKVAAYVFLYPSIVFSIHRIIHGKQWEDESSVSFQ